MSENVVLMLDDEEWSVGNCWLNKLETRFKLQSKGMKKYLDRVNEFIADPKKKFLIEFYNDRQLLMKAFRDQRNPIFKEFLPNYLREDREFVLHIAKTCSVYGWSSSKFLNDFDIVLEMIKYDADVAEYLPATILKDREKVKLLVQANGEILDSLYMYDKDREIGLLSVKNGGPIPLRFMRDKEFIKEYAIKHPREPINIGPKDKDIAMEIVKSDPVALLYLPMNFRRDKDIIYEAVKVDGKLLGNFINNYSELKQDRELILTACRAGYSVDADLAKQFYSDREVLLASLKSNPYLINMLDEELKRDKELLRISLLHSKHLPFNTLPDNLGNDKGFMRELIVLNPKTYELLSRELRKDRELAILALESRGELLEFVDEELKADRELVRIAISNCGYAIKYAHNDIINDMDFAMAAIRQNGAALIHLTHLNCDRIAVLEALRNSPDDAWSRFDLFEYASDELKDDRDFVKQVLKISPISYRHISKRLKDDTSLILELVDEMPSILNHNFHNYNFDREFILNILKRDASFYYLLPNRLCSDFDLLTEIIPYNGQLVDRGISNEQFHQLLKLRMDKEYPQLFFSSTHNAFLL